MRDDTSLLLIGAGVVAVIIAWRVYDEVRYRVAVRRRERTFARGFEVVRKG